MVLDSNAVARRRSMVTQSAVGKFVPVERGVSLCNNRPRVRVSGRFASEVPGIEFLEGGVDVVEVEHNACHDLAFGVDLGEAKNAREALDRSIQPSKIGVRPRTRRRPRIAITVGVKFVTPTSASARTFAISASRPCLTPAFTT